MALEESDLQIRKPQTAPAPVSLNADAQFHRLLVPLDGSPLAEAVLPYVRRLASPRDTQVILLQVISPAPLVAAMETPAAAQIIVEAEERDRVEAQRYLEQM